jgi:lipopolysaccharide/colanic/teichoic acid biosynthesis glycosyltransferase
MMNSDETPTLPLSRNGYNVSKRLLDIVVASLALLVLLPFLMLVAFAIRLTSPGPALYRSRRIGKDGRTILFLKFRSMYVDAELRKTELLTLNEKDGPIFKIKADPRITPLGRILRKYSIDELPQLIHVLLGEMSLVGPRPHPEKEAAQYTSNDRLRLTVTPGLTCYWQIMGRSELSFREWIDLDLRYIQDACFMTDLRILARTPIAVLRGRGAY